MSLSTITGVLGHMAWDTLDKMPTRLNAQSDTHTHPQIINANKPKMHVFGLGEETGLVSRRTFEAWGEDANFMHTEQRWESNQQPWKC